MSIACKNKSTAASDFVDEPEVANPTETLTPTGELPINKGSGPSQYENKKFVSKKYKDAVSGTAKVKFYNDASDKGWADFKPSDYNFTLKLALTNQ